MSENTKTAETTCVCGEPLGDGDACTSDHHWDFALLPGDNR